MPGPRTLRYRYSAHRESPNTIPGVSEPETESGKPGKVLWEAGIEAERTTGVREARRSDAIRHLLLRMGRVSAGMLLLGAGAIMLVLPGPGIVVVFAGLSILAIDIPFAARVREYLMTRVGSAVNVAGRRVSARLKRILLSLLLLGAALLVLLGALLVLVFVNLS
jgi:uncharacterized protein (TIGR02611 family)